MGNHDQKGNRLDLAKKAIRVLRFSQASHMKGSPTFHFGDFPFAVSVFCTKQGQGYIADFWISGRKWSDDEPRLVMRVTTGVHETKFIEAAVTALWEERLEEMAFGSAIVGGFWAATPAIVANREARDEMLAFHLVAHDRFAEAMRDPKRTKVEQTAIWHNLIRSFGVKQTQKIIARHEVANDLVERGGITEEFEQIERNRILAVNARLTSARKKGLLTPAPPTGESDTTKWRN